PRHAQLDPTVIARDRLVLWQDGFDPVDDALHQGGEGSLLSGLPVGPSRFDVFLLGTFISHWRLGTPLLHRAAAAVTQCSGGLSWPAVYSSPTSNDPPSRPRGRFLWNPLASDLFLQFEDTVQQRLGPRRTTRHVHIDGNDPVDTVDDVVLAVIGAAVDRAAAHGQDPPGLGHLVVQHLDPIGNLFVDRPRDDHQVRLPRRGAEDHSKPVKVIPRRPRRHHFNRTASDPKKEVPKG